MELCECGGTDLQSQHLGVSAEGGVVRGQEQPRLYNKKKKTWGSNQMNYGMCMKMKLCDSVTAVMKNCRNIKTFTENATLSLAPLLLLGLTPLDKSPLTRPCLRLSLREAAMTCVAFPLWNISPAFLHVLIKVLKSHKLKNSW